MKNWFTAQELADFNLKSLPNSKSNVIRWAKKDGWTTRKRSGRGGGQEYSFEGLPAEVQAEIKTKAYKSLLPAAPKASEQRELVIAERDLRELTHTQRETADARLRMALLVAQYEAKCGSRTKAIKIVSQLSRELALPEDYNEVCETALAKKLKNPGVGTRKLHQWCLDADRCDSAEDRLKVLAPQKQGQPVILPTRMEWLPDFMAVYRNTNGLCVAEAYRTFAISYGAKRGAENVPLYDAVRRALDKMPRYIRECGRITGAKMRALKTYQKRDWSTLVNNDVWVGDGHSLKMKVAHPDHGRPFTPELTLIMDAASRYIVGWSLAYSENQLAVGDALRHAMTKHGIPAIYYSDNGSGQTNKTFDTDVIGILPRLGVHHETGIPGNPQGRGIIERVMKTLAHPIARQFQTYYGPNVDSDTLRKISTATDSLAKAEIAGRTELTPKQKWAKGKLPSWAELLDVIESAVNWYNNEHKHSALGNVTPIMMRQHIFNQMDSEDIVPLTEVEARDMFRPAVTRKVARAWITVYNNEYWHKALEAWDGKEVVIYLDQHDPSTVIVRDTEGAYVCDAILDGNKRAAFGESLVQRSKRQRAEARIKKLDEEYAKAVAETRPTLEHEKTETLHELFMATPVTPTAKKEYVMFASELENKRINE